ncbi:OmpA family protein [Pacificibacter marinus]|uniref:Peptidoglycan-binding protein ArfA n=1 Tax=Pacificibacter marinus TaxID=658057 RepID=A0A1Y5TGP8_9RHOB|nr:OmpA family protein [Pacificibacter marinus]SEL17503.1 OmpA-OmpF porin, OOP family [Pacificibacter marinus]SLN63348.1 Peptidoglycan-binding protein ArfA [Pacificibacter marinus]
MRLSSLLPVLGAFCAAAILSLGAASIGANTIQRTSQSAVAAQMELAGFEWVTVDADGLQVILTGNAPNEAAQLAAQRAAGHVVDAARVMNVMGIAEQEVTPPPHFSIEILRNDQGISLIGLVPTSWDRERFIETLKKAGGTGSVADLLEHADYDEPEHWAEVTRFGVEAIKLLQRSKISLAADRIDITALADSKEQKANFERDLQANAPSGVVALINITSPRPVITPFTARFLIDEDGARFDACTAETPQGHARLLAAAKAMGIDDPNCIVGLGAPSTSWANAVESGMRAVQQLGGGSITFSDADVSLIAAEGTSEAVLDRVAGDLEAALPDTFSLHTTLPVSTDEVAKEDINEFVALRSPEGQVQLRGRVPDDRSRIATEALAGAAFGSQAIYSAMRIDADLPRDWSTRVMTSVDVLSHLNQGSVTVHDDQIYVRGESGDPTANAEITRLLSSRLGDAQEYDITVKYIRKLDPILNLPTPQECVDSANSIISNGKIVFAPGSTDVDSSADDTLDRLAKALKDCEDMQMEIGGHTDSQGRETMNQQLSQARANAVLDALLGRRVIGVKFTAKGYGEEEPIADNDTEEGREANRRITFKLLDDAAQTDTQTSDTATQDTNGENNE